MTLSTIAGAVTTLQTHMANVATANPSLNAAVYVGPVQGTEVADNYLQVGEWETGAIWHSYVGDWAFLPGASKTKSEDYHLYGTVRTWAGNVDVAATLDNAITLLSGVVRELTDDIGGSGQLSPSGSWQVTDVDNPYNGPFVGAAGFGVVVSFDIHVVNVQLSYP
jgi:hypothetical protein